MRNRSIRARAFRILGLTAVGSFAVACAPTAARVSAPQSANTRPSGKLAEGAPPEGTLIPWADFNAATFARAKAEHRYVVLDGAAEWCHWCHVMDATTYHDPEIVKLLGERFIAVKVDVDSRPDIEERYGDYGWPATVIFAPDATELGKYKGYIAPDRFAEILREVVASHAAENGGKPVLPPAKPKLDPKPMAEEMLAWIERSTELELGDYYDDEHGGWGRGQKAPLYMDNEWALFEAKRGDADMRAKAFFTLDRQSVLIDPVWGGIYQYSAADDWDHAHFEKLMTFEAGALDNYSEAYAISKDAKYLAQAKAIHHYIDTFLKGEDGGFYTTQDADLNAHDPTKPFMDGHDYYKLGDAERRARGLPRIDTHEYARENGLAIAAYCTYFDVSREDAVLATAAKAAERIMTTHMTAKGGVLHDAHHDGQAENVLHLSDNATFGLALVRLYEETKRENYLVAAKQIADFLLRDLEDKEGGGFFSSNKDPDAVGIFQTRRTPFEENVVALRFFARLERATQNPEYGRAIDRTLRGIVTPDEIKNRGRILGDFLMALEETKGVR